MKTAMLLLILLLTTAPAFACPMCKDSTVDESNPTVSQSSNLDFNKSIYLMLGGFVTVAGLTGRVMYRAVKTTSTAE